ncbi:hypothetical protein R3P38DRAFT_1837298 [Favolaschia claudopus]|uniref:Secreted protein n=1 Tax=Favolaschia claudopus TaxID=2862362 RepID=A0AAW0A498_9AGAR
MEGGYMRWSRRGLFVALVLRGTRGNECRCRRVRRFAASSLIEVYGYMHSARHVLFPCLDARVRSGSASGYVGEWPRTSAGQVRFCSSRGFVVWQDIRFDQHWRRVGGLSVESATRPGCRLLFDASIHWHMPTFETHPGRCTALCGLKTRSGLWSKGHSRVWVA